MKQKPEKLWAFWANMYGCYYKAPKEVKYDKNLDGWWHECGEFEVHKVGFDTNDDETWICFSSEDKKEVQTFINGYMACKNQLKTFIG